MKDVFHKSTDFELIPDANIFSIFKPAQDTLAPSAISGTD